MSIGDLVANLGVNKTGWTKDLGSARKEFSTFASGMSSSLGSLAGMFATSFGAKVSIDAFSESLAASRKLEAGLKATGGAAGLSGQQIADYASELQSVTNFEDDATVSAAGLLTAFTNVKGDVFKEALASAQDMSAMLGADLEPNVKLLGKALNDPAEGMAKLAEAGIQFTSAQYSQVAALQKSGDMLGAQRVILDGIASKFGGAAIATADPMKQLSNTIGDMAEGIGSLLLPAVTVGATALSDLLGTVAGGADSFRDLGIEAAVQLSHIGSYLVLSATQWQLYFVQAYESATHFFTVSMPKYLDWFADNWQNIFVTVGSNTLSVFENLASNIKSVMTEIWDYIASGGKNKLELSWTPLTTGFLNTIQELPDIPDRVVGDFEKSLLSSIEAQSEAISESITAQRKKLTEAFSPLKPSIAPGANGFDEFGKEAAGAKAGATKSPASSGLSAALIGSQQAAAIMLGGVGKSSAEQLAAQSLEVDKQMLAALNQMKDNSGIVVEEVSVG